MTRKGQHVIRSSGIAAGGTAARFGHGCAAALGSAVQSHSVGRVVVLEVAGPLGDVVPGVDHAAQVALADGPRGVVCDLSRVVETGAPGALRSLALAGRHPRDWPGVPLAIAGLGPRAGETLRQLPLGGHLVVAGSVRQGLSMVLQARCPAAESLSLAPHPTAPRASRDFVSRTLLDWRLSQHIAAACLVVSELVTNAMTHAGTDIELTVAMYRQAVRIGVRDGSPEMPVERRGGDTGGRGMAVVLGLSTARGVLPTASGGKVVWAVLDGSRPERAAGRPGGTTVLRWGRPLP